MLQIQRFALFCGVFAVFAFQAQVVLADESESNEDFTDNNTLFGDFQALRETIDLDALVAIIQSHYQCDSKFRQALSYYNTARFRIVTQQLQRSEGYHLMLKELRTAGVDTGDIENINDIFDSLILPEQSINGNSSDCKKLRGHTFMGDLLAAMPQEAVHEYIAKSRSRNSNFALFVDTITSPEFQSQMRTNMMKRDTLRPLRVLRRNGWDVEQLLHGAMTILSW